MRPGSHAWSADDYALLRTLVRQRKDTRTIAALLGRTPSAVSKVISRKRLIVRQNKRSGMTDAQFRMNLRRLCLNPVS